MLKQGASYKSQTTYEEPLSRPQTGPIFIALLNNFTPLDDCGEETIHRKSHDFTHS